MALILAEQQVQHSSDRQQPAQRCTAHLRNVGPGDSKPITSVIETIACAIPWSMPPDDATKAGG